MKQTIRSIGPLSLAKILAILYAGIGLIIGALVSLVSFLGVLGSMAGGSREGALGLMFGAGAIVILPIFYAIVGLIGGLIAGFLFNIAAKFAGGLVIELD